MTITRLQLDDVSVTYTSASGRQKLALEGASFALGDREFVSVIGPSGCGKSTLLHCAGGLTTPTSGTVTLLGREIVAPRPHEAAFVFQDYSLYPWKSVVDNVSIGLRFRRVGRRQRRDVAMHQLHLMGLQDVADAYPAELSGGMQQRVAVARGLAMDPDVLLMDEPFGALDEITRRTMGVEVSAVLTEADKSLMLVTHSLDEAIFWGDRILVMGKDPGRIIASIPVEGARPRPWNFVAGSEHDGIRARLLDMLTPEHEGERSGGADDD